MTIRVTNAENGINEEFKSNNLDFIRRSYTEFDDVQKMSEEDYKKLAILIVKKRYTDTRFDNLEWIVTTEND
ncbi:hypothetical protein L6Q79_07665 [bacterium]|nr:hypothetical protein [bacterium]NUN44559.1 hypothetical protein [bacterium]